ncbi:MAG: hypothetical protein ACKPKO_44765, partial [Candidatus Fonsibacter sp.]
VRKVFLSVRRGKELIQALDRGIVAEHMQWWPKAAADLPEPNGQLAGSRGDDVFLVVTKGVASILGILNQTVELDGHARLSLSTALRTVVVRKCLAQDSELQACIKHVVVAADAVWHLTPAVIQQTVAALVSLVGDPGLSQQGGVVGTRTSGQRGPPAHQADPREDDQQSMDMVVPQSSTTGVSDCGSGACKQREHDSVVIV